VMALILTFFVSVIILYSIILPLVYGQINTNVTIPLGKQMASETNSTRVDSMITLDLMINPNFTFFYDTPSLSFESRPIFTTSLMSVEPSWFQTFSAMVAASSLSTFSLASMPIDISLNSSKVYSGISSITNVDKRV
jgi:hypothetical protein